MKAEDFTRDELEKAVALFYDGRNAPHVSAKGQGDVAREIMAIAEAEGVPLCDNRELVELLVTLELGDEIPESLYIAVAHIIAFAYELQGKKPEGFGPSRDEGQSEG
ncbi:EscU/YscU/HrcU family type III secretion system export apparatus switch protein [Marinimicrobium agarilyticum]|uniref:EscU/YscU/HrcU family type III secretion system export apparatus switch protein n=1 Tax=Marinimicrobium agarilyticum TaxID=306546 RepID=UPI000412B167|nr:EscU/YscU/HrcU family type III secretion system export apparatus switch protein [Marinimicrobium agarilyticum]